MKTIDERVVDVMKKGLLVQPTGGDKCPTCKHSGTPTIEIEPLAETKRQGFSPALAYVDFDVLRKALQETRNDTLKEVEAWVKKNVGNWGNGTPLISEEDLITHLEDLKK